MQLGTGQITYTNVYAKSQQSKARARIMRTHANVCLRLQQFVTLIYNILSNFRSQFVTI